MSVSEKRVFFVVVSQPPKITMMPLEAIRPDPDNANRHTERGQHLLTQSLQQRGFFRPMAAALDAEGKPVMLAGNHTQEVAAAVGMTEAIVIESDGTRPIVHVRTDLAADSTDARLLSLEDNRIAQLSIDFDPAQLAQFADTIQKADLWSEAELEALTQAADPDPPVQDVAPKLDKAAELQQVWQVQPGQLWQCGSHRVLCGDATKREDIARLMGAEKAVLCHADPPYGMGKENDGIANDNLYGPKLDAFQLQWWQAVRPYLTDNASAYIWGNAENLWRLWYCGGLKESERLTFRNEIVWDKGSGQGMLSDNHRMFPVTSERCLFFMLGEQGFNTNADNYWEGWDSIQSYLYSQRQLMGWNSHQMKQYAGGSPTGHGDHWTGKSQWIMPTRENYEGWQRAARGDAFKQEYDAFKREYDDLKREYYATRAHFDNTHDNMTDVWSFSRVIGEERWGHATPKPVEMITRIIKSSAPPGGIVLDPFCGSGTSLVAAQNLGCRGRVIEINPSYCAVTLERMRGFGLLPTLIK